MFVRSQTIVRMQGTLGERLTISHGMRSVARQRHSPITIVPCLRAPLRQTIAPDGRSGGNLQISGAERLGQFLRVEKPAFSDFFASCGSWTVCVGPSQAVHPLPSFRPVRVWHIMDCTYSCQQFRR